MSLNKCLLQAAQKLNYTEVPPIPQELIVLFNLAAKQYAAGVLIALYKEIGSYADRHQVIRQIERLSNKNIKDNE